MNARPSIYPGAMAGYDSWLHRLDSRSKFIVVLIVMVLCLFSKSLFFYVISLGLLVLALMSARITVRLLSIAVRPLLLLVLVTMLFHLIFGSRGGEVLVSLNGYDLTTRQFVDGSYYSLRLLLFVSVALLLALTTTPSEIADGLVSVFRPLRKIGLPVNDFGLMLFIALRFVPILRDEFVAIQQAQEMRGVGFTGAPLMTRMRRMVSLLLPVFTATLRRADELALAIQARGYRSETQRTCYSHHHFGLKESSFVFISAAMIVGLWRVLG